MARNFCPTRKVQVWIQFFFILATFILLILVMLSNTLTNSPFDLADYVVDVDKVNGTLSWGPATYCLDIPLPGGRGFNSSCWSFNGQFKFLLSNHSIL